MGLTQGNVKVTVEMVGKGDAPKKVKETSDAIDKTKKSSAEAEVATKSLKDRVDSIKGSVGPVNLLREGFENLKGNLGFVGLAVGALTGLFGSLIDEMSKGTVAAERWKTAQANMEEGAKKTRGAVDALRASLDDLQGKQPKLEIDVRYDEATARIDELRKQIVAGEQAAKEMKDTLKALSVAPGSYFAIKEITSELKKTQTDLIKLRREEHEIAQLTLDVDREREIVAIRMLRPLTDYLSGGKKPAPGDPEKPAPNVFDLVDPMKAGANNPELDLSEWAKKVRDIQNEMKKPRGGGGGSRKDGWKELVDQLERDADRAKKRNEVNPDQEMIDIFGTKQWEALKKLRDDRVAASKPAEGFGGGTGESRIGGLGKEFDAATEAVDRFSMAMAPLLEETFPGLGQAVSGIDTIMQAFAATTDKSAKAQVQAALTGSTAVAGGIGKILGGKKGMWIAESIAEGAAAAASFAVGDFWGGGQHLISSASYAAAAASAGGGGGGGSRSSGGGGGRTISRRTTERSSSQNSPAVIINGNWMGSASPQETAAEMRALQARGERSGFVPRGR